MVYSEKKEYGKCPQCGCNTAIVEHSGDLESGWDGGSWGKGNYTMGVISHSIDCPLCKFHADDQEIND